MRRSPVLEEVDALPGSQAEPRFFDRDRKLDLGQRALDVRGHVIRPLRGVLVESSVLGDQPTEERLEVGAHIGVGVLLDQQRCGRVWQEHREQAALDALSRCPGRDLPGDLIET